MFDNYYTFYVVDVWRQKRGLKNIKLALRFSTELTDFADILESRTLSIATAAWNLDSRCFYLNDFLLKMKSMIRNSKFRKRREVMRISSTIH